MFGLAPRSIFPTPRGPSALVSALAVGLVACIDTELAPTAVSVDCASRDDLENVVFITAGLGNSGVIRCSGVAVTRTLIVTALGCVTVPNQLADSYGVPSAATGRRSGNVYYAGAPGVGDCVGGVATEDGSFSTLYGSPLPPDVFDVYLGSERVNEAGHEVSEILRAPSTRCSDGIALLRLPSGIGLDPIPLRATLALLDDEPLVLSHLSVASGFTLQRKDSAPTVAARAGDGTTQAPRSLELAETCPEQSGGGLFSSVTGALVGVLTSSLGAPGCETPARGTGVPLAPFRRMLIEAASEELLVEGTTDGADGGECVLP